MFRFLSVLALIHFIAPAAPAQWVQTNGPEGGSVSVFLPDGPDIYAGTFQAGIFKSTDGGATWQQKINGFGYQTVMAMAKCGPFVIASGTEGLYRSSDGADSWTLLPGFDALGGVATLAVQGPHVIAGTSYGGVYASSDTGATWVPSNAGLPVTVDELWVPASTAAGADFFIFGGSVDSTGVFRSTDLGATWTRASAGLPEFDIINALFYNGSTLFAAGTEVYRSTDMGGSWTPAGSGIPAYSNIECFTSRGSTLFAGGWNGVFATNNVGGMWVPVAGGLPVMEVRALATHGSNLFAGTIADGIYGSTNAGTTWFPASAGIRARNMSGFRIDGSVLYGSGQSVFRTTDGGDSWTAIRGNLRDSASVPTLLYAAGDTLFVKDGATTGGISRSFDGGLTWTGVWPELYDIGMPQNIVRTASGFWTAVGSIYHSTDNGTAWGTVDSTATANSSLYGIEQFNGSLFAFGARVFRSTDDGSTWGDVTPSSPSFDRADLMAAAGGSLFLGDRYNAVIWRSTDAGSTWAPSPSPVSGTIDQLYGDGPGTTLFACGDYDGIYMSTDGGTLWTNITPGLPDVAETYTVAVHDAYVFAGLGGNSVWRRPLSQLTSVDGPLDRIPVAAGLAQNYPNPFNPSTTIGWSVASAGRVVMKVYDVLGREMATLFDGVAEPGERRVIWDAGAHPGGVYYCRMTAGSSVETKAMLLVR